MIPTGYTSYICSGQIPLQYAAIEKDVKLAKSNEIAHEQEEENGSQPPKGSTISREQVRAGDFRFCVIC